MNPKGSFNKYPSFNGEGYALWKENMRIFVEEMDFEVWKAVKDSLFFPTLEVNDAMVNKKEEDWTQ